MQYTRKQIIEHLRKHQAATVPVLSRSLNLTLGNIRHHIKELQEQRVVEEIGNLPVNGRGRPTKIYGLSKGALEHNLNGLAEVLLDKLFEDQYDALGSIQDLGERLAQDFQKHPNLIQNLNHAVEWLNKQHYLARWEASATGPRVILGHCPYYSILETHPEMCRVDAVLVSRLVGVEMEQKEKISRVGKGGVGCVYVRE